VKLNLDPVIGACITLTTSVVGWYGLYRVYMFAYQFLNVR
jgi:hypothetical protein